MSKRNGTEASPSSRTKLLADGAGKTELDHALAERANVRDHVDVAGADVRRPVVDILNCTINVLELGLVAGDCLLVVFCPQYLQAVQVVLALFFQSGSLALEFLLSFFLFAETLTFFAFELFLVGEFLSVVGG